MADFWIIEGIDGAGKTHAAATLENHLTRADDGRVVVVRKDGPLNTATAHAHERLAALRELTWHYPGTEEVWTYPRRYWLHSLAAWFELFHHELVQPELANGSTVIADGWYFKHQARFRLSDDPALIAQADVVFASLPQPDRILHLDTPPAVAAQRRSHDAKPTEHGAFDTQSASTTPARLTSYQQRTRAALGDVLRAHPAPVTRLDGRIDAENLRSLIEQDTAA